jgi:predicted heme/steroid binding protein
MKKILSTLLIAFATFVLAAQLQPVFAQGKVFTLEELSQYDGKDGRQAYYAYKGVIYDVTESRLWKLGEHFGLKAGNDLTGKLEGAPHGEDVVTSMPVVGSLAAAATVQSSPAEKVMASPAQAAEAPAAPAVATKPAWYEGRIRIAGISILGWTGILLAFTFVVNFATCFALPWSHFPLPWAGSRPGKDALDTVAVHKPWASIHKPFAWATVVLGVIHGVLGLLQLLGIYL